MNLTDRIKVALTSFKENLISREAAIEIITAGLQEQCEGCSHKEVFECPFVPSAAGVECTE